MTEGEGAPTAPAQPGTGAHFAEFLDWAESKGELPGTTVQNWRNAATKVLEIEDDWKNINVVEFDLDSHINRFQILRRTSYTESSMSAYKSRTRVAIESYRKWVENPGSSEWKPKLGAPRAAKNGDAKPKKERVSGGSGREDGSTTGDVKQNLGGGHVPNRVALIEYPFPIRAGVQARLALPEDLSDKEAKRIARFVESLAIPEQLAITGAIGSEE